MIKKQLLKYYLTVPVIVTFLAGLAGTIIGYSPIGFQHRCRIVIDYFSIPDLSPELFNLSIGVWNCYAATCCSDRKTIFVYKEKKTVKGQHFSMIRNEQKEESYFQKVKIRRYAISYKIQDQAVTA